VKTELSPRLIDELKRSARQAATQAYAPYSRFQVARYTSPASFEAA